MIDTPTNSEEKVRASRSGDQALETLLTETPANVSVAILHLRDRANSMMNRAAAILFIIVAVLVSAATLIVFAAQVARIGVPSYDPMAAIERDRTAVGEEIIRLDREIEKIRARIAEEVTSAPERGTAKRDNGNQQAGELSPSTTVFIEHQTKRLEDLIHERGKQEDRRNKWDNEVEKARTMWIAAAGVLGSGKDGDVLESISDPKLLLAAGLTRLGILIVAIYLVRILVNLYRYNTRVSAHYSARADALILGKANAKSMKELGEVLYPDISYEKEPKFTWEKIEDAIKERIGKKSEHSEERGPSE